MQRVNQHPVGDNVQFFLCFTLNVARARLTQHAAERALSDAAADADAGLGDVGHGLAQIIGNAVFGGVPLQKFG